MTQTNQQQDIAEIPQEEEVQHFRLGNYDKEAFMKSLALSLLKIPNLPKRKDDYKRELKSGELGGMLKQRVEDKQEKDQEELQQLERALYTQTMKGFQTGKKKRNYLNLFSVDRGQCRNCFKGQRFNEQKQCKQYRACYNIESFRKVDIFECLNCSCPMNSHVRMAPERSFSNLLCKHVNRRYIEPAHLDFKALVAIFFVDKQKSQDFEIDVETFVSALNEGSFNILSFSEFDLVDLQRIWIQKRLYSLKSTIQKDELEEYINFLDRFLELFDMCGQDTDIHNMRKRLNNPKDIEKLEFFNSILEKVTKKLITAAKQKQIAFIFLMTANKQNPYSDFKKFLSGAKEYLPIELQYFYSSKSKYHGVRDSLLFFTSFFKLSIQTFIVTQKLDQEMSDKRVMNDTFKDMLDFNNFQILKDDFSGLNTEIFKQAFSFMNNEAEKFINYCLAEGQLNIKIVSKIGPSTVTILSQAQPNFHRIASAEQNQMICDRLCPELFNNQRVLVIYRPLIVKSGLEELMGAIWKANQFVLIRRTYKRFTLQEAKLLASIEKIHLDNVNAYIQMMMDGYCFLVLYARPGAYSAANMVNTGCETGLNVRKSKILQDVFVEHPMKSGLVFKEKLHMNFHNIYESYTEANIFRSIKDLFDLEELVLQENVDLFSKNVFMDDEDEHVFLAQKPEVRKTTITSDLRTQIVRDLQQENFNFFLMTTQDDLITEQLVSLFLPDCSQIQVIYLVVKPLLNNRFDYHNYIEAVKAVIKRMNFIIVDCKKYKLTDRIKAEDLIECLSPYRLTPAYIAKYTDLYFEKEIYLLSVAKPAAIFELKTYLSDFSFEIPDLEKLPSLIQDIIPIVIPCLNIEIFRYVSKLFNPFLDRFDGTMFTLETIDESNYKVLPRSDEKSYILNYILMSTFGIEIEDSKPFEILSWEFYEEIKELSHVHIKVASKHYGDVKFEIRVRNFSQQSKYSLNYYHLQGEYQLLSWFYYKVNNHFKQRCPITYQYRIFHPERAVKGEFDQIFDCQEFSGKVFLLQIYQQIFTFGNEVFDKIKQQKVEDLQRTKTDNKNKNRSVQEDLKIERRLLNKMESSLKQVATIIKERSKMISYFWGVKLAKFTKELELILPEEFPNGYGQIICTETGFACKFKAHSDEHSGLHEVERIKYEKAMDSLADFLKERMDDENYDGEIIKLGGDFVQQQFQKSNLGRNFYLGRGNQKQTFIEQQIRKFFHILFPDKDQIKSDIKHELNEIDRKEKLNERFQPSPFMQYILDDSNLRLLPGNLNLSHLRITMEKEVIKSHTQHFSRGQQLDWNYEANEQIRKTQSELKKKKFQSKQPLNNYVLTYCPPEIRSRFALVGNVLFLLWVELREQKVYKNFLTWEMLQQDEIFQTAMAKSIISQKEMSQSQFNNQQKLDASVRIAQQTYYTWFRNNFEEEQKECDRENRESDIIKYFIQGFEDSYFLEEDVIQKLQSLQKEQSVKKKGPIPNIIYAEVFLYCLEQLDIYIKVYNDIWIQQVRTQKQLNSKKQLKQKWQQTKGEVDQDTKLEMNHEEKQLEEEIKVLEDRRKKIEGLITSIFKFILSDDFQKNFFFDSEETELKFNQTKQKEEKFNVEVFMEYMQNNLNQFDNITKETQIQEQLNNYFIGKQERNFEKEFIPSKRYFLPLEQGNNLKEWGKLDEEEINEKLKQIDEDRQKNVIKQIEQFNNAPFLKKFQDDAIQGKWLQSIKDTQQGKFVDTRPDKKKTGFYIDTVKNIDQNVDEKIDKVIKKFMADKMNNFENRKQEK